MPRAIKRRMLQGVGIVRDLTAVLKGRHVPEHVVLCAAERIVSTAVDLESDIIGPDAAGAAAIALAVEDVIARQSSAGLRGSASVVIGVPDDVTRTILIRQLPTIDRLMLLRAVLDGVEAGLRVLLRSPVGIGPSQRAPPMPLRGDDEDEPVRRIQNLPTELGGMTFDLTPDDNGPTAQQGVVQVNQDRSEYRRKVMSC